jgi:hypothetical protein
MGAIVWSLRLNVGVMVATVWSLRVMGVVMKSLVAPQMAEWSLAVQWVAVWHLLTGQQAVVLKRLVGEVLVASQLVAIASSLLAALGLRASQALVV